MASKFAAPFVLTCSEPLREASKKLASGHLSEGLADLSRQRLESSYQKGIEATMRKLRVPREAVESALPSQEIQHILQELDLCQSTAHSSVGQFVGTLGSLLPGAGKLDHPASSNLRAVADKYALDAHIAKPVRALSEAVARWEEFLTHAAVQLSSNAALRAAVLRRRLTWVAIALAVMVGLGCLTGIGLWHRVVIAGAQQRIEVFASDPDPCRGQQVDPDDLDHALPQQRERLEQMKSACAKQGERELYLARCAALAEHIEAGKLTDDDIAIAGSARGLLERVARRSLTAKDLMVGGDVMPCGDTPNQDRLWKAFAISASGAVEVWGEVETISPHVAKLLTSKGVVLSDRARVALLSRVEADTKRAITKGTEPELDRARRLCELVNRLGYPKEPWCKALDRIDSEP